MEFFKIDDRSSQPSLQPSIDKAPTFVEGENKLFSNSVSAQNLDYDNRVSKTTQNIQRSIEGTIFNPVIS